MFRLQAMPVELTQPVGQRFGMSLLEVFASIKKAGICAYLGSSGKPSTSAAPIHILFRSSTGERLLSYSFSHDKCNLALLLPLAGLASMSPFTIPMLTSASAVVFKASAVMLSSMRTRGRRCGPGRP